jgi:hypothetical protein
MRVALLILLIALTPLRGWANDVMATRMASQLPMLVQTAATAANAANAKAHSHCEDMAASQAPASPAPLALDSLHCDNCALCQMGFAAVLPVNPLGLGGSPLRHTAPALGDVPFRSAALSPGHKPPIS